MKELTKTQIVFEKLKDTCLPWQKLDNKVIARNLGCSQAQLANWRKGKQGLPAKFKYLNELANMLNTTVEALYKYMYSE